MILDPFLLPYKKAPLVKKIQRYGYKCKKQESAGTVVYKKVGGKVNILLIHRGGYWEDWTFPKGVIENNQSHIETAIRETWEEVGLKVDIVGELPDNRYKFYLDDKKMKMDKVVYYFLAEAKTNKVDFSNNPDKDEADSFVEYGWVSLDVAIRRVKHEKEKEILKQVSEILNNQKVNQNN